MIYFNFSSLNQQLVYYVEFISSKYVSNLWRQLYVDVCMCHFQRPWDISTVTASRSWSITVIIKCTGDPLDAAQCDWNLIDYTLPTCILSLWDLLSVYWRCKLGYDAWLFNLLLLARKSNQGGAMVAHLLSFSQHSGVMIDSFCMEFDKRCSRRSTQNDMEPRIIIFSETA